MQRKCVCRHQFESILKVTFFDVIVLEQIEIMNLSEFLSFHKAVMQNMRWIYVAVASPCTRHGKEVVVQLPVRCEPKQEVVARNFRGGQD